LGVKRNSKNLDVTVVGLTSVLERMLQPMYGSDIVDAEIKLISQAKVYVLTSQLRVDPTDLIWSWTWLNADMRMRILPVYALIVTDESK